jgi:methyl-accepting chemotaxis protein
MSINTKNLFLRPFLFQEGVTYLVLVPHVIFFFLKISPGFRAHILEGIIYVMIQTVFSVSLGAWVKYHFASPAIKVMEKGDTNPEAVRKALRSASILPLAEGVLIYVRWAGIAWCSVVIPLYMEGILSFELLIFGGNILGMTGISGTALYYLVSENSLAPFYEWCSKNKVLFEESRILRISLNQKLLAVILLIAIPPIGDLLGIIYLSIYSGIDLASIQIGFFFILLQTVIMTFLNGILLMRGLTQSVGRMSLMLKDMAKGRGDLTKRLDVKGADEVGELARWFNDFMDNLEDIIGHVRDTSLQLHESVEQVSSGSQGLSQSTQEQAASVEQISASIEEMHGTLRNNADLIKEGKDTSNAVTKLIEHSRQVFAELMKAISEISQDSKKIGDIVVTVNEVAFHTNLLALNASVEAARAGEHGKGFAVVAGEVRSLAQRSAQAASEIKVLIEGTVSRINNGDEMMKKTAASMEELMGRMEFFFRMMEVIGTSSTEQTQNIGELNHAISQIEGSTQHNASTVEQLASTLDSLRTMANVLAEDVQKFKTSRG